MFGARLHVAQTAAPGALRLSLSHREDRYAPVEIPLSLSEGEEKKLEATLRPR